MSWNYRVFKEEEDYYTIMEVFYDDAGNLSGYCPAAAVGESPAVLLEVLDRMKTALEKPVLKEEDFQ
jgi:hypothetical protein